MAAGALRRRAGGDNGVRGTAHRVRRHARPHSHNLWPFEILQAGAISVVVMVALLVARKLSGAGR